MRKYITFSALIAVILIAGCGTEIYFDQPKAPDDQDFIISLFGSDISSTFPSNNEESITATLSNDSIYITNIFKTDARSEMTVKSVNILNNNINVVYRDTSTKDRIFSDRDWTITHAIKVEQRGYGSGNVINLNASYEFPSGLGFRQPQSQSFSF